MSGNHWTVQIKKMKQGGVRLKFCGHFHTLAFQVTILVLIVFLLTLAASLLEPLMNSVISALRDVD